MGCGFECLTALPTIAKMVADLLSPYETGEKWLRGGLKSFSLEI
jgi:hypothetical protein